MKTVLVTPNHEWASDWGNHQDPPIDVRRDRSVIVVAGRHDIHKLMGLQLDGDTWRVRILGWPENTADAGAIHDTLYARGWTDGR